MQNNGGYVFCELEIGGRIIECPQCHVTIHPHLGNLVAPNFQCESCKVNLSFRNSSGRTVQCPCCNFPRPVPSKLQNIVCGRCNVSVIHEEGDRAVKCFLCKHITNPPQPNFGFHPVNQVTLPQHYGIVPPQVNRVVPSQADPSQVNRFVPPQDDRAGPSQINRFILPQNNQAGPSQVNRIVPSSQDNQAGPSQANQTSSSEESGSSSSSSDINVTDEDRAATNALLHEAMTNAIIRLVRRVQEEEKRDAKGKRICP